MYRRYNQSTRVNYLIIAISLPSALEVQYTFGKTARTG
jgi:hypothetical protein